MYRFVVRNDLAVYFGFPYGSGDKLCVLGAKIKDENFFRHSRLRR